MFQTINIGEATQVICGSAPYSGGTGIYFDYAGTAVFGGYAPPERGYVRHEYTARRCQYCGVRPKEFYGLCECCGAPL